MLFLGLDTATRHGSIALSRAGQIAREEALEEGVGHSRDLLPAIDRLIREQGIAPADLSGVGVTLGPGSFTGVRVGMATAKGLAYALDIGLAGLSTLEALARAALRAPPGPPQALCAVLDAGRGEVYAAIFGVEEGALLRSTEDRSWKPGDLLREMPPGGCLVGDGIGPLLKAGLEIGVGFTTLDPPPLLAGTIAQWAFGVIPPGSKYRPGALRPNYIRPSDAEAARRRS